MRKSLWIMAAMGLAGILAMMFVSESTFRSVSGIEEAVALQDLLRSAHGHLVEPAPPLMVYRVPGSPEWPGFRWKVEATLRKGLRGTEPEVRTSVDRIVARALGTTVQGRRPSGLMLLLHVPGGQDQALMFDKDGIPIPDRSPSAKDPK